MVWKAKAATNLERRQETNISAGWEMELRHETGLPNIVSVLTKDIEKCILVHEHWQCSERNHLPSTELPQGSDRSMFVIDESYERYAWLLNLVSTDRWEDG